MNEKETKQVEIKIGGETKTVAIWRYSAYHGWACDTPVLVRFPTGKKIHRVNTTCVYENNGKFGLEVYGFRNANRATVYAWDNGQVATSKWRG